MKRMAVVLALLLLCGCGAAAPVEESCPVSREPELSEAPAAGYVALTFDDGPSRHTERLLDGLAERGAKATFFLLGSRLEGREDVVQRMKAEGHQIGNHSYTHKELGTMTDQAAAADLARCDLVLCTLLGEGDYWVRPPYGSMGPGLSAQLDVPVVLWSVDPEDWSCQDADAVTAHILSHVRDGDIVLLHDCYTSTVDAALRAVDALQERGIQLVTVEQLLTLRGRMAQSGAVYHSAP